jgi:hypothetical protein
MPFDEIEAFLSTPTRPPRRAKPVSRDPVSGEDLYLPEGWGGPSASDFAADEAADTTSRPSVRSQLRGTVFDDSQDDVDRFLSEPTDAAAARGQRKQSTVRKWVDRIFSPPEFLQRWSQKNVEALQPAADRGDKVAAFLQGAHEGAIGLMNPFDVVTTAASVGPAARALRAGGALARSIPKAADVAQAGVGIARGTTNVAEGLEDGDFGKVGQGVFETAMGGAGAYSTIDAMLAPGRARAQRRADRESFARHRARINDANVAEGRDYDEFNRWRNDPEGWARAQEEAAELGAGLRRPRRTPTERPSDASESPLAALMGETPAPAADDPIAAFLEGAGDDVMEGEIIPQRALPTAARPALPEPELAAWFAGEDGTISRQDPTARIPESRQLPKGSIITPPPVERPKLTPLQASLEAHNLTEGELRMAYIDAATAGDTGSVQRLEAELQRRATPEQFLQRLGVREGGLTNTEPTPFFDAEGRFTLDPNDMDLPADVPVTSPEAAPTDLAHLLRPDADVAPEPPAVPTGPRAAQGASSGDIVEFAPQDVGQIGLDPTTYQFKTSDARGRTSALEGVKEWDPWSPPIVVHRTPDGKLFVADGHQRYNKYLELAQSGAPVPPLRARVVEGPTESIMRAASLRNIQEGSADPLDIARLIRNGGDLTAGERARIGNLSSTKLRQGQDLSKLGPDAFTMVLNGAADPAHAAFVGRHIADPAQQATVMQQLGAAQLDNATQAEAFVKAMRDAGFEQAETFDLFGSRIEAVSLAKPKAQIVDATLRGLVEQRRAFKGALANAKRLEEAGNVLAGAENARLADEAGKLRSYFEALYDKPGTATHAALRDAATAVHNKTAKPADAAGAVLDALRADLETGNYGAAAKVGGSGRPGPDGRVAGGPVPEPPGPVPSEQPVIDQTAAGPQPRLPGDVGAVRDLEIPTPTETLPEQSLTLTPPPKAPAQQPSLVDAPAAPPKKARQLLEEHLGKEHARTKVREVMDAIVAKHPKDTAAQAKAAQEWIANNPDPKVQSAQVDETPWNDIADGGQQRTVKGAAGDIAEVRYAERPPVETREALMAEGYKYDFRDRTWRKPAGPTSTVPSRASSSAPETGAAPSTADQPKPKLSARRVRPPRGTRLPRQPRKRVAAAREAAALPPGTDDTLKKALESGDPKQGEQWAAEQKRRATGTDLASGFAGLEQMFKKDPATAWLVTRMAVGATIGAARDDEDPWLGFIMGAGTGALLSKRFLRVGAKLGGKAADAIGSTPWTAAKAAAAAAARKGQLPKIRPDAPPKTRDFTLGEYFRRPEGVVPEHFERIQSGYGQVEDFLSGGALPRAKRDLHGNISDDPFQTIRDLDPSDPRARTLASGVFFREALSELRKDLKAATEAKQTRRANYLRALERAVLEEPGHVHKFLGDALGVGAHRIQKVDNTLTNHAYRILLGAAADTAVINRTQPGLNVKNVPFKYVAEGMRQSTTPEGKAASEFARVHRPMDVELGIKDGKVLAKLDEWLQSFMASSDTMNRRDAYLAARQYALDQGIAPATAEKWAKAAMRQTQGEPGPAGKHPLLREMGPLRAFANYPHMWAELIADTIALRKDNPEGFRRLAGYLVGGGLAGAAVGINTWNLLFPRFGISTAAIDAPADLARHALHVANKIPIVNKVVPDVEGPDHSIKEDIFGGDGKPGQVVPRYPRKVYDEVKHLLGYGIDKETGEHITRDARGRERSRHTTLEGLLNLAGIETTRQAREKAQSSEAYRFSAERKRTSALARRGPQRELADAIDAEDHARVREILQSMPARQRREMRRAVGQTKWKRLRAQVPKRDRSEFDRLFGENLKSQGATR